MKLTIDTNQGTLEIDNGTKVRQINLYSDEAFNLLSEQWVKIGWNQKYPYTFSWLGHPIIQIPDDMVRLQEVVYRLKPDVIIETGVAYGGSLIFSATLCKVIGKGRVIGIDIDIRPPNRSAIESHLLSEYITLVEGNSASPAIVAQVKGMIKPQEKVLVILDSNHSKAHVLAELNAYHDLIQKDFYIIATDGKMKTLSEVPRGKLEWAWDNPCAAVHEFLKEHPEFVLETPPRVFDENRNIHNITHWPEGWLKRI